MHPTTAIAGPDYGEQSSGRAKSPPGACRTSNRCAPVCSAITGWLTRVVRAIYGDPQILITASPTSTSPPPARCSADRLVMRNTVAGFGLAFLIASTLFGCCRCARSIKLVDPLLNGHSRRMTYLAAPESLSTEKSPSNNRANCSRAASAVCPDNTDNVCERTRARPESTCSVHLSRPATPARLTQSDTAGQLICTWAGQL